jgi:hypothetical protein
MVGVHQARVVKVKRSILGQLLANLSNEGMSFVYIGPNSKSVTETRLAYDNSLKEASEFKSMSDTALEWTETLDNERRNWDIKAKEN